MYVITKIYDSSISQSEVSVGRTVVFSTQKPGPNVNPE